MKIITCAVCNKEKPANQFGDGIKAPQTTCLSCAMKANSRRLKQDVEFRRQAIEATVSRTGSFKPNPIQQYLIELSQK